MKQAPLDELYFRWLYGQVGSVQSRNPTKKYWKILKKLFTKEFVWIIPNDDNRAEDGRDLRYEFINQQGLANVDQHWMQLGCSMLEMLIALSRRLSFEDDGEPRIWFWHLMENVGLGFYNDNETIPDQEVDEILDRIIWRTYKRNGSGGLFPLKKSKEDQRKIELWYQLCAYLLED
jgi:hypothetical protein